MREVYEALSKLNYLFNYSTDLQTWLYFESYIRELIKSQPNSLVAMKAG